MDVVAQIAEALKAGDDAEVSRLTEQAIGQGVAAKEILDNGLIAAMAVVGQRFKEHDIFLPDVLLAAKAMYAGLDRLRPLLAEEGVPMLGKVVLGTIQGDLHDIGKNLVGIMLKGAGYEVIDLGNDVAPERFVEAAREQGASVIGMSALLTTTMAAMQTTVELLREQGLAGRIKTIVGGAPVSAEFAERIGADGYGFDAGNAVERVEALMSAN